MVWVQLRHENNHIKSFSHFRLQVELENKEAEVAASKLQSKQAASERAAAVEAKELAEQKMVSIEYEFEQHKERAIRREKELVDELSSLNNDDAVRSLKEKLQTMSDRANSFETQLWQNQNKRDAELEAINQKMVAKENDIKALNDRLAKIEGLQKEYDELSTQLMGYVEENDELKELCARQNAELDKNRLDIIELQKSADEIVDVKAQFDTLLSDYNQLEHNNNISTSAFNQARLTIDCFKKECDILRNALVEAQAILAQQELANLKLQKSICEYNDTLNASQLNETTNIMLPGSNNNNNNGPLMTELTGELEKASAERDGYASKLKVIRGSIEV